MKVRTLLVLFLPILILAAACSGKAAESAAAYYEGGSEDLELLDSGTGFNQERTAQDKIVPPPAPNPEGNPAVKSRKLIKNADVEIRADTSLLDSEGKFFGASKKVDELLRKYDAYSEQSTIYENSLRYTIRVPLGSYETMLTGLSDLGKITSRVETAEDVTLKYYDLAGRLATKKTLLGTFQSYLSRAATIEDILSIETRIAELQNEIDWLGTQLAELANLTDYATIRLSLYSAQATTSYTLADKIGDLFKAFGDFLSGALVLILGIIIFGVPIVILILLAVWLLFGRIGLLRKAFRFVAGLNNDTKKE
jgi:hypothetical protein